MSLFWGQFPSPKFHQFFIQKESIEIFIFNSDMIGSIVYSTKNILQCTTENGVIISIQNDVEFLPCGTKIILALNILASIFIYIHRSHFSDKTSNSPYFKASSKSQSQLQCMILWLEIHNKIYNKTIKFTGI